MKVDWKELWLVGRLVGQMDMMWGMILADQKVVQKGYGMEHWKAARMAVLWVALMVRWMVGGKAVL